MKVPVHTPWGAPDMIEHIVPDHVVLYTTPSHGGYWVSPAHRRKMPAALRAIRPFAGPGWYEEDCDWAIVALSWPGLFQPQSLRYALRAGQAHQKAWGLDFDRFLKTKRGQEVAARGTSASPESTRGELK